MEESNAIKNILWEERRAFSLHSDDTGNVPDLKLHLQTRDEKQVQRNYNSIQKQLFTDVKNHIQGMLDRQWIQKSSSQPPLKVPHLHLHCHLAILPPHLLARDPPL